MIVSGGGKVYVDSAGGGGDDDDEEYGTVTENGLLTILGKDCDFEVSGSSIFGKNLADPASGGYTKIISMGGDASQDTILATGGAAVYGRVYATAHALSVTGSSTWYGSVLSRTVTVTGSGTSVARIVVDESSVGSTLLDSGGYDLHARWFVPESN